MVRVETKACPPADCSWEFLPKDVKVDDLVAVPIDIGDELEEGGAQQFLARGLVIGKDVRLKRRVTGNVVADSSDKKRKRHDVNANAVGKLVSYSAPHKDHVFVEFALPDLVVKAIVGVCWSVPRAMTGDHVV